MMPHKELETETAQMQRAKPNQLFVSLLQLKGGWRANHALQRTLTTKNTEPTLLGWTMIERKSSQQKAAHF